MKAADFIYHRARSVEEALGLLEDYDGGARILAGGQSLMPMMNMRLWRPSALIDINGIEELCGIEEAGHQTILGAMVRHVTVKKGPTVTTHHAQDGSERGSAGGLSHSRRNLGIET